MAVHSIRVLGDPVLRMQSNEVHEITEGIIALVQDMAETMYEAPGAGLAAPQIGVLKKIIVFDSGEGFMALINPRIIREEGQQEGEEGCLSVPGEERLIKRAQLIEVEA